MKRLTLVLVAMAAIVAIAPPALAEYSIYGSVRVKTFYVDNDKLIPADTTKTPTIPAHKADDQDFTLELQPNTRFGAKVKADNLSGHVEFGLKSGTSGVYTRLAYGTLETGAGRLLVGQAYSPYFSNASQVYGDDSSFAGFGNLWDKRNPQIRFDLNNGLYIAATKVVSQGSTVTDTIMPKMTVGFKSKADNLSYNVGTVYQAFDTGAAETTVTSYLGYADLALKLDRVALRTKLHYGQNLSDLGMFSRNSSYNATTDKDTSSYGGWIQAGVGMATAGFGYVAEDIDGAAEIDDQMALFVNYKIKLAKGVTITPEVLYKDYMDSSTGADQGDELAIGAQWKFNF